MSLLRPVGGIGQLTVHTYKRTSDHDIDNLLVKHVECL